MTHEGSQSQSYRPQNVLILSPLKKGNGNYTTVDRIRRNLATAGHHCDLCDPKTVTSHTEFTRRLEAERVDVLMGIHAYKTGPLMRESGLPYMLILGGTDIHEFSHQQDKMAAMTQAVHQARFIVCFSESNKHRAMYLWPDLPKEKVKVISQAVETSPSDFHLLSHLCDVRPHLTCLSNPKLRLFVMVGGVRPVKNPVYLVNTFQEWHKRDGNILLVIIGHKLDEQYCSDVFQPAIDKAPGVVHIPGLPICDVHAAMCQATALVNSSDSEGMCLSILEAMTCGTAVMARDIPANRAIVTHHVTGLLYDSPEAFLSLATQLTSDRSLSQRLTSQATDYVTRHHAVDTERHAYLSLLEQCDSRGAGSRVTEATPLCVPRVPITYRESASESTEFSGTCQDTTPPDHSVRDLTFENNGKCDSRSDITKTKYRSEVTDDETRSRDNCEQKHDINHNQIHCKDRTFDCSQHSDGVN